MKKLKGRAKHSHVHTPAPIEAKGFTVGNPGRKKKIIVVAAVVLVLVGGAVAYKLTHRPIDPKFIDSHGGVMSPEARENIDAPAMNPNEGTSE